MNTVAKETTLDSGKTIPTGYKERGLWFAQEFWETLQYHIQNLLRFCEHLPKSQAISYSEITEDNFVHAHYGKFAIFFPVEKILQKIPPADWMHQYSIEIDNKEVILDSWIQEVWTSTIKRVNGQLETRSERILGKLLPERILWNNATSRNTIIKRMIRVRKNWV